MESLSNPTTPDQGDERRAYQRWVAYAKRAGFLDGNGNAYDGQQKQAQTSWFTWQACEKEHDAAQPVAQEAIQPCAFHFVPWTGCASCERWKREKEHNALAAPQPSQGVEPVAYLMRRASGTTWALAASEMTDDVRRAFEMDDIEIIPLAAPQPPVSADRYKRALEAIIANPGGASAKRIATLALGLDGTEHVSAEAGKGVERKPCPEGWAFCAADFSINATSDFTAPGNVTFTRTGRARAAWFKLTEEEQEVTSLYVSGRGTDFDEAWNSGIDAVLALVASPSESVAVSAAPMPQAEPTSKGEKLALMPYEPTEAMRWAAKNLDPVLTHDNIRALWSAMWVAAYHSQQREPQEAAEREAQLQEAREQGWRAAIDVHSRHGMAGWSSHKDAALSAPQEASKPAPKQFYIKNIGGAFDEWEEIPASKEAGKVEPVAHIDSAKIEALKDTAYVDAVLSTRALPFTVPVYLRPTQQAPCEHCDDTGDVHGYDGEWRGYCECHAGVRLHRDALLKTITTHPSQQALSDAYKAGWRVAARWAKRDDLPADIGSPAYEADKQAALSNILAAAGGSEK